MITESDLRDLLHEEAEDASGAGVTVAGVNRRIGVIRRRRLRLLGGAVAAGLAVAAALTLPGSGGAGVPDDIWSGVMAQPSPRYGAREVSVDILDRRFSRMGERIAVDVPQDQEGGDGWGVVECPPEAEMLYWLDGVYRNGLVCNQILAVDGKETFGTKELMAGGEKTVGVTVTVPRGTRRLEFAVVPPGSVRRLGRPLVNERDAQRVLGFADGKRAEMRFTLVDRRIESCDSGPGCRFADESIPPWTPAPAGTTIYPEYPETGSGFLERP
ncbi:hypothetical protein [Streptosporangium sp. NPDC051022]|uniref:hypothetical protein n=1 Tax=Streptosporangium sp. NPDC051022 TaxID=3155752 RepID=UPI00343DDBA3